MPGVAAVLTAPPGGVDVAVGVVLLAAGLMARRWLLLVAGVAWLAGDLWSPLVDAHRGPLASLLLGWSPLTALVWLDGLVAPLARAPWPTLLLSAAVVGAAAALRRAWPLAAAAAVTGALACEAIGELAGADTAAVAAWWYDAAVAAVGIGYLVRPAQAATTLVVELGEEPRALRAALRHALGDPALEVAYRAGDAWLDEAGQTVTLPGPGASCAVRLIGDAAVVYDPAALPDDKLAQSVDAAVRLALANVRLQDDVAARVRELEQSRRRLVEAGDAERRRLREQLREGAERELLAARRELADAPALSDELDLALADLRRFAQGIHPPALAEHGLRAALAELVPATVVLDVTSARVGAAQESAAYFVCAEALANAAKYAAGARVRVTASGDDGRLLVRVTDDGPGGADPRGGSGLRGLTDRVEALGGRLRVASPPGAGTTVEARLPAHAPARAAAQVGA